MPGGVEAAGGARAGGPVGPSETVLSALVTAEDGISWHVFLHAPGPPLTGGLLSLHLFSTDGPGV